jgi:hypothetical protein
MSLPLAKTAIFILGLSAGALGSMLVRDPAPTQAASTPAPPPRSTAQPAAATAPRPATPPAGDNTDAAAKAEQDRLRKTLEERNQALEAMEQSLNAMQQTIKNDEQEREERREAMRERFTQFAQGRLEGRMASLDSVAHFDDEQYDLVAAFLEERTNLMMELRSGRWNGELTEERETEIEAKLESMKLGQYLQEILGPQQYADYSSHRQQRNTVAQEAYASRELSHLVETVRLSDQQLDEAYSVYYREAENAVEEGEFFDSRRMREQQGNIETRTDLLRDILDEQQLSAYRIQLESAPRFHWR